MEKTIWASEASPNISSGLGSFLSTLPYDVFYGKNLISPKNRWEQNAHRVLSQRDIRSTVVRWFQVYHTTFSIHSISSWL